VTTGPLDGLRALVTRPDDATALADALRGAGASVVHVPATRIVPAGDAAVAAAWAAVADADWVVFTSRHAVEALTPTAGDARLRARRVVAVGPATAAALAARGVSPALVPERAVAEGVLDAFDAIGGVRGATVAHPVAAGARPALGDGLVARGATYRPVVVYASEPVPEAATRLAAIARDGAVDLGIFTAPSTVAAWVAATSAAGRSVPAACLGPVTAAAARDAGLAVVVAVAQPTADALVAAVAAWWGRRVA
jgi:uroporphyrinogen-III synthase